MSYVIAIDVGIKNLGMCVFDYLTSRVVLWENETLVPNGRYMPSNNVAYVRAFVQKHNSYFDNCAVILVERQMRCNMKIIEAILQTMFFPNCIVLSARSVKAHYDLCTKNYKNNKAVAVEWARAFVDANPGVFSAHSLLHTDAKSPFLTAKKQDDYADSLLLVCYYLDTYSNQLT